MLRGTRLANYHRTQDERRAGSNSYARSGWFGQDPSRPNYFPDVAPVVWNLAGSDAGITVDEALAKAASGTFDTYRTALGSRGATSGKRYIEFVFNTIADGFMPSIGIAPARLVVDDTQEIGGSTVSMRANGDMYNVGVMSAAFLAAFADGDTVMMAVDIDNGLVWFGKNGVWANNADLSLGATSAHYTGLRTQTYAVNETNEGFPMASLYHSGTVAAAVTIKYDNWAYTAPAGFLAFPGGS